MAGTSLDVVEIDGHDFFEIGRALDAAWAAKDRPVMILANTVKGKGVGFMENQAGWHGKAPNGEQYETAKAELDAALAELTKQEV